MHFKTKRCHRDRAGKFAVDFTAEFSSSAYTDSNRMVVFSRPMQKKVLTLITCQLATPEGRGEYPVRG